MAKSGAQVIQPSPYRDISPNRSKLSSYSNGAYILDELENVNMGLKYTLGKAQYNLKKKSSPEGSLERIPSMQSRSPSPFQRRHKSVSLAVSIPSN